MRNYAACASVNHVVDAPNSKHPLPYSVVCCQKKKIAAHAFVIQTICQRGPNVNNILKVSNGSFFQSVVHHFPGHFYITISTIYFSPLIQTFMLYLRLQNGSLMSKVVSFNEIYIWKGMGGPQFFFEFLPLFLFFLEKVFFFIVSWKNMCFVQFKL